MGGWSGWIGRETITHWVKKKYRLKIDPLIHPGGEGLKTKPCRTDLKLKNQYRTVLKNKHFLWVGGVDEWMGRCVDGWMGGCVKKRVRCT